MMQRTKLQNKLWNYFNRGGGTSPSAPPSTTGATSASAVAGAAGDEPDGPDAQQQYRMLFGMRHAVIITRRQ